MSKTHVFRSLYMKQDMSMKQDMNMKQAFGWNFASCWASSCFHKNCSLIYFCITFVNKSPWLTEAAQPKDLSAFVNEQPVGIIRINICICAALTAGMLVFLKLMQQNSWIWSRNNAPSAVPLLQHWMLQLKAERSRTAAACITQTTCVDSSRSRIAAWRGHVLD